MHKTTTFLFFTLFCLFLACQKESPAPEKESVPVEKLEKLVGINQLLGWKIFREEQRQKPGENVLISPFSIQTAIQMTLNGTKGDTREEFLEAMGCPGCDVEDLNLLYKQLNATIIQAGGHPTVLSANSFFYDKKRILIKKPFQEAIMENYACNVYETDFSAEQVALQQMNEWVKNNTNGKIEQILKNIKSLDVAFLLNALYFKADWQKGFNTGNSYKGAFKKVDGTSVTVDYLDATRKFTYAKTPNFNIVDLPFKDSTYSLSLIQPSDTSTNLNWHLDFTATTWLDLYKDIKLRSATVRFPKLKLAYAHDLIASFKTLGVSTAFSPNADLSNMGTASSPIIIDQIIHKVVLNVDEKGAEGAAVTVVNAVALSGGPLFIFNRPFVLVLRHIPTNTMIFTGYVADPAF